MVEVERVRPVQVRWHVMSLARLNADREMPERYRTVMHDSRVLTRVVAAAAHKCGDGVLAALYTELGTRVHNEGRPRDRHTAEDALAAADLPTELAAAVDEDGWDEAVASSHDRAMEQVGLEVGTPVIAVDGHAFFGPVVTPAPRGEAAGRLWDGVNLVAGTDGFFEIKRSRNREPVFG
jgi:2-hydroxychromene-2-carboxylate isomerase